MSNCVTETTAYWAYDDTGYCSDDNVTVRGNNCALGCGMDKSAQMNGYDNHNAADYNVQMHCWDLPVPHHHPFESTLSTRSTSTFNPNCCKLVIKALICGAVIL